MVVGDTNDATSLRQAFSGASAIFAVTDFWGSDCNVLSKSGSESGQKIMERLAEIEIQSGKNIADAAADTATLRRFIWSSLPAAKRLSGGKYSGVYHFDAKAVVDEYIQPCHLSLWAKTSILYMGFFTTNWKTILPRLRLQKVLPPPEPRVRGLFS